MEEPIQFVCVLLVDYGGGYGSIETDQFDWEKG